MQVKVGNKNTPIQFQRLLYTYLWFMYSNLCLMMDTEKSWNMQPLLQNKVLCMMVSLYIVYQIHFIALNSTSRICPLQQFFLIQAAISTWKHAHTIMWYNSKNTWHKLLLEASISNKNLTKCDLPCSLSFS